MRLPSSEYVIIALSGRALAQAAARSGIAVHVFDCCADQDTRERALTTVLVGSLATGFDTTRILHVLEQLRKQRTLAGIVTGSGFENRPELLANLQQVLPVFGNAAAVVEAVTDPTVFFPRLAKLGIPFPETRQQNFDLMGDWLLKRRGGSGGWHIRRATSDGYGAADYCQRRLRGTPESLVFLADGRRAWPLGFNQCWLAPTDSAPYRYGGSVTRTARAVPDYGPIVRATSEIVASFGLRGLCGLDFLRADDGGWSVLEVNPRPPATFELHDRSAWLFRAHLNCCRGQGGFSSISRPVGRACAHAIVYAQDDVTIHDPKWPEWVSDRPVYGSRIEAGQPICTVQAVGPTPTITRQRVAQQIAAVQRLVRSPAASAQSGKENL